MMNDDVDHELVAIMHKHTRTHIRGVIQQTKSSWPIRLGRMYIENAIYLIDRAFVHSVNLSTRPTTSPNDSGNRSRVNCDGISTCCNGDMVRTIPRKTYINYVIIQPANK
jgi:hypothetical protein